MSSYLPVTRANVVEALLTPLHSHHLRQWVAVQHGECGPDRVTSQQSCLLTPLRTHQLIRCVVMYHVECGLVLTRWIVKSITFLHHSKYRAQQTLTTAPTQMPGAANTPAINQNSPSEPGGGWQAWQTGTLGALFPHPSLCSPIVSKRPPNGQQRKKWG